MAAAAWTLSQLGALLAWPLGVAVAVDEPAASMLVAALELVYVGHQLESRGSAAPEHALVPAVVAALAAVAVAPSVGEPW